MMGLNEILLPFITIVPLIGVVILLIWRKANKIQAAILGIVSEGIALVIAIILLGELRNSGPVVFSIPWIPNMGISFTLSFNWL